MKADKRVISIAKEHIEPGIKKYRGEIDAHIASLLKAAKLAYTPYLFADGRVLLVLPNNAAAFLYESKDVLFQTLQLEE